MLFSWCYLFAQTLYMLAACIFVGVRIYFVCQQLCGVKRWQNSHHLNVRAGARGDINSTNDQHSYNCQPKALSHFFFPLLLLHLGLFELIFPHFLIFFSCRLSSYYIARDFFCFVYFYLFVTWFLCLGFTFKVGFLALRIRFSAFGLNEKLNVCIKTIFSFFALMWAHIFISFVLLLLGMLGRALYRTSIYKDAHRRCHVHTQIHKIKLHVRICV